VNWLALRQLPNGAWPGSERVPEPGASTGIAVLALAACPELELRDRSVAGAEWLLEHPGERISWLFHRWMNSAPERNRLGLNLRLRGWPWKPGLWGFVEPTAIALIALRALREDLPERRVRLSIGDGEAFLLGRTCPDGGWNYGIGRSKNEDLWPYPDTTAFALLALGPDRSDEAVGEGISALRRMLESPVSRLSTALGILAFESFGENTDELHQRLVREWADPFPPPTTRTLALSLMAARGDSLGAAAGSVGAGKRGTRG
jgi:hypothetical protein